MSRDAEYWQRALAAFKHAKLAANEQDRMAWLGIAEGFVTLFRKNQSSEEQALHGACDIANPQPNESVSLH